MEWNGPVWGACNTPQEEADNVFYQVTGCGEWDIFDTSAISIPNSLDEWEKI